MLLQRQHPLGDFLSHLPPEYAAVLLLGVINNIFVLFMSQYKCTHMYANTHIKKKNCHLQLCTRDNFLCLCTAF